jgi:hypothetical protein
MTCPKCEKEMEFEEAKNHHGYWYCECGFECPGSHVPCDCDMTETGHYIVTDYEDSLTP